MGTCKVEEIILNGDQTEEEQRKIVTWHHQQLALDQAQMPRAPLSLEVEEVHCTLMDVLHLSGQCPAQGRRVLLKKLENAGIRGLALDWFRSFLSNRGQTLDFWSNNVKYIDISVLQGSILRALLFLVFINDLPRSNNAKNIMYADKTFPMCKEKSLDLLKTTTES